MSWLCCSEGGVLLFRLHARCSTLCNRAKLRGPNWATDGDASKCPRGCRSTKGTAFARSMSVLELYHIPNYSSPSRAALLLRSFTRLTGPAAPRKSRQSRRSQHWPWTKKGMRPCFQQRAGAFPIFASNLSPDIVQRGRCQNHVVLCHYLNRVVMGTTFM